MRVLSLSSALLCGLVLAACDRAISDRYDGLEVVEVVEVVDTRDPDEPDISDLFDTEEEGTPSTSSSIARPTPRPAALSVADAAPQDRPEDGLDGAPEEEDPLLIASVEAGGLDASRADLLIPPQRPQDVIAVADGAGADLEVVDLQTLLSGQIFAAAERPAYVSLTAEEDQLRLARLAEEEAIALVEAENAAALAALAVASEEDRLAELAAQQASGATGAGFSAGQAGGVGAVPNSIFAPITYASAPEALATASQLNAELGRSGLDLSQIMAGAPVPNLIIQRMPGDMAALGDQDRPLMKEIFIKTVLPLCLRVNARIAAERDWYEAVPTQARRGDLTASASRVVRSIALKYQTSDNDDLLERLAPIPPSLCLAQAIHDSDWGRNSAVQNQNGLFGSWSRSTADPAVLLPMRGRADTAGEGFVFSSLERAVDAYALFLNRYENLASFRARRAQEIAIGQVFNGRAASLFMDQFRPLEAAYRDRLLRLIDENDLDQFDLTRLDGAPRAIAVN